MSSKRKKRKAAETAHQVAFENAFNAYTGIYFGMHDFVQSKSDENKYHTTLKTDFSASALLEEYGSTLLQSSKYGVNIEGIIEEPPYRVNICNVDNKMILKLTRMALMEKAHGNIISVLEKKDPAVTQAKTTENDVIFTSLAKIRALDVMETSIEDILNLYPYENPKTELVADHQRHLPDRMVYGHNN